jgi:hypothetical protein
MKILSLVFAGFAVAGFWGHLEVTLFSILMLVLLRVGSRVFARQDAEYARTHPPKPACTLVELEKHEQQCNAL